MKTTTDVRNRSLLGPLQTPQAMKLMNCDIDGVELSRQKEGYNVANSITVSIVPLSVLSAPGWYYKISMYNRATECR